MEPWQFLLDLVLPRFCVGCKTEGTWLCQSCLVLIEPSRSLPCPFCETVAGGGKTCEKHHTASLDGLIASGYYHDPILRATIQQFKYGFAEELAVPLGQLLLRTANTFATLLPSPPTIIPIPLTKNRFRKRGFNQAHQLAQIVALSLHVPLKPNALIRTGHAVPQALHSDSNRRTNLEDPFAVSNATLVRGQDIVLIDDVSTTGATLEIAARALKNAGAASVMGLVLARG